MLPKKQARSQTWWHMPIIFELARLRQEDQVPGQSGLHSRASLKKTEGRKTKKANKNIL
jgi:hypothetical protein